MSDLASGAVPVGLELAARAGQTTVGVLVEYGRALVADCPGAASCSGSVVRAGLEVLYRFTSVPGGSGWLGGGLGWEGTRITRAGRTTRYDALELLNLQAGRDFAVGSARLGPFLAITFAQAMQQDGKDLEQKSPHAWVQAGIRVELGP
jgi:hypothetical protein